MPGDRYLLCSDGLSGVVSDETLRDTLSSFEDPDTATRQLIDLAIHGGGPDNITCIVADVVDSATTRLPLTTAPVLAGAAASLGDPRLADGTGPFGIFEDHPEDYTRAARTAPQPAVDDLDPMMTSAVVPLQASDNGDGPPVTRARRSHRAQPRRSRGGRPRRRRWPIVTTALVVLLGVVIGGVYVFYRVSQNQYFVKADSSGQVVMYRGINYRVLGFSWFSSYLPTRIMLDQVPQDYRQTIVSAGSTGSQSQVSQTVMNIRTAVDACRTAYATQQDWVIRENAYDAYRAKVAASKGKHPAGGGTVNPGPPVANPGPRPLGVGQQPSSPGGACPPPTVYGIPASALNPAPSGSS